MTPVGSCESGKNYYGLYDMAGNVWEWTSSLYQPYPYDAKDGCEDVSVFDTRGLCGGSRLNYDDLVRSTARFADTPETTGYLIGFRCARNISP